VQLLYQSDLCASSIQSTTPEKTGPVEVVENLSASSTAKYFIAVCASRPTTVSHSWSLGVGGIEHQIAIIQDLRQAQKEISALLHQRAENEREYARNLAAHRQEIEALQKEIEALLRQREENEREYARNLAAQAEVIRQQEGRIAELQGQRAELEEQCAVQRIELDWLYRWIPVNKLARRFLFGRNLRRRLTGRFREP
jgi:DNA repair exonuclease SbcCD ATPase subunit